MKKFTPEQIERARTFLKGRPGAKMMSTFHPETKTYTDWWIGRLAGRNVTCQKDPKHTTREAAVADARAFLEHCRQCVAQATA